MPKPAGMGSEPEMLPLSSLGSTGSKLRIAAFPSLSIRTLAPPGSVPESTSSSFPTPFAFWCRQMHCSDVLWFWVLGVVRIGEKLQLVFDSSIFGFHARKKKERQGISAKPGS